MDNIESFHNFYTRVSEIHKSLVKHDLINVECPIKSEIDEDEAKAFENIEVDIFGDQNIKEESFDVPVKSEDPIDKEGENSSTDDDDDDDDFDDVRSIAAKNKVKVTARSKLKKDNIEKPLKKYNMPPRKSKEEFAKEDEIIRQHMAMFCDLCDTKFDTFPECSNHYRTVHNMTGYLKCCEKKFLQRCRIMSHIQWHIDPLRYIINKFIRVIHFFLQLKIFSYNF